MPEYETLGNGGLMYRVFDTGKELRVAIPTEDENNDTSEIQIPYKRIWVGGDTGFELIAEIACYEDLCSYVFIGPTVTFFWITQPIELYHSYVGNSGVPYGFAATKDYVYGFTHTHMNAGQVIEVSRRRIEQHLGKSLSGDLTIEDLYDITFDIMEVPYTAVKQETLHDNFQSNRFEPFDQTRFQQILQNAKQLQKRQANFSNTTIALGSRLPMNVARHIATFRTGLNYRPYKKSTGSQAASQAPNISIRKCKNGKCAVMGGKRTRKQRVYKRKTYRRTLRK